MTTWGILGTGGIAAAMTADLKLHGHEVVAVGSRSRESAARFAAAHGIPRSHLSLIHISEPTRLNGESRIPSYA